jgi:hypothetical protein
VLHEEMARRALSGMNEVTMEDNEILAANRRNWDERVPIYRRDRSGFYAVERFLAGDKHLYAIELGELGDVAGERVVHLRSARRTQLAPLRARLSPNVIWNSRSHQASCGFPMMIFD